jgi:hypothetical protein
MLEIEYTRPLLKKYQLDAFFHPKRYAWVEGTVKAGKTVGLMAWLTEQAYTRANINYWWIAPVYGQARIAYTRTKNGLTPGTFRSNDSDLTITLPTTPPHVVWYKTAEKPDNLYGEDVGAAGIDEGPRMREAAWWAVRSTLTATRGPVRGIGNVRGRSNWFYKLCRAAEADPNGPAHYAKITALDAIAAGILDAGEIEDARSQYPESVFNELFMAVPSEDGSNPFGFKHISACVAACGGVVSLKPAVCYGVDLGKALDWTVIIGLDEDGRVRFFERFQSPWTETKARIRQVCGTRPTLVDSTGLGDPVLEDLRRGGGLALDEVRNNFEGYRFTPASKQKLMEGLVVAVQQGKTSILEGPHRIEMESFEFAYSQHGVTYQAPEGTHDDCPCAHALAVSIYSAKINNKARRVFPNIS